MCTIYCCNENQPAKDFKFKDSNEKVLVLDCCYKCKSIRITTNTVKLNAKESKKFWNKYQVQLKEIKEKDIQNIMNITWIYGDKHSTPRFLEGNAKAGNHIKDLFSNFYFDSTQKRERA